MSTNDSNSTCGHAYGIVGFRLVAATVATASGVVCLLCAAWSMVVLVASKALRDYQYRLIFYYCITAAVFGAVNAVNRADYFVQSPAAQDFCPWAGFALQCAIWSLLASALTVNLSITVKTAFQCEHKITEPVSLVAIFIVPPLVNWIPFVKEAYGKAGNYCYIASSSEGCAISEIQIILEATLLWLPWLAASLVILVVSAVSMAVMIYRTRTGDEMGKRDNYSLARRVTRRAALSVLWCPFVLILLQLPLVVRVAYDYVYPFQPLAWMWYLSDTFTALDPGLIAIGYTLSKHLLVLRSWKESCSKLLCPGRRKRSWSSFWSDTDSMDDDDDDYTAYVDVGV